MQFFCNKTDSFCSYYMIGVKTNKEVKNTKIKRGDMNDQPTNQLYS